MFESDLLDKTVNEILKTQSNFKTLGFIKKDQDIWINYSKGQNILSLLRDVACQHKWLAANVI
jgi:hypothetical protein